VNKGEIMNELILNPEKVKFGQRFIAISNVFRKMEKGLFVYHSEKQPIWNRTQESRLIESMLLKIPLPFFYATMDSNEKMTLFDGIERLNTIYKFIKARSFALESLEFYPNIEKLRFHELSDVMQIILEETELLFAILYTADTPKEVVNNIINRIQTKT